MMQDASDILSYDVIRLENSDKVLLAIHKQDSGFLEWIRQKPFHTMDMIVKSDEHGLRLLPCEVYLSINPKTHLTSFASDRSAYAAILRDALDKAVQAYLSRDPVRIARLALLNLNEAERASLMQEFAVRSSFFGGVRNYRALSEKFQELAERTPDWPCRLMMSKPGRHLYVELDCSCDAKEMGSPLAKAASNGDSYSVELHECE